MANIASAKKRIRSSIKNAEVNKNRISSIRTSIKKVEQTIVSGKKEDARKALASAESRMMIAAGKGTINKKAMSRKVSRLNKSIKNLKK